MNADRAVRRDYDGSSRRARSDATRTRILDIAREQFIRSGYRATTISDIANAAEVHIGTVYELVGRKPVLLRELIERAISGADRAVDADERDYVVAMRAEQDPARKLQVYAAAMRSIQARLAPLLEALRDAATTEPDAAEVWNEISERRALNMRRLVSELADAGGLRNDLSVDDAADFVWATNSPEMYLLLTGRGWDGARYEAFLADVWQRYILPTPGPAPTAGPTATNVATATGSQAGSFGSTGSPDCSPSTDAPGDSGSTPASPPVPPSAP